METNKILGAVILALLIFAVLGKIGNGLVSPKFPEKNAFYIEVPENPEDGLPVEEVDIFATLQDISPILASANIQNGEKIAKKCASCHSFNNGGENKVGPNLWSLVNKDKASVSGFAYSSALVEFGGQWDYEELNKFLLKPKKYIPGTKMNYNGLKKDTDRADLILWLRSLSDDPVPLP